MKSFFVFTLTTLIATSAWCAPLLERELFNSRSGESFVCRLYENGRVELYSDNQRAPDRVKNVTLQPDLERIQGWIAELKKDANFKKVAASKKLGIESLTPEKTTQYIQRGTKEYFVLSGGKKVSFYKLKGFIPEEEKAQKDPAGTLTYKLKNYQQLRGAVDLACKMAM